MSQAATAETSTENPSPPGAGRGRLRGHPWLSLLAVALGVMLVALDGTIVAIASPAIQQDLNASLSDIQWVTNAYLLAIAVTLITIGKIGDRFGHTKIFLTGAVGFVATSAGIGMTDDIKVMIGLRVLQGVFGAMLQPTALGIIRATFPAEKLNTALGIWGAVVAASTAGGPIVGGLLVEHVNWESCFYVNVPVGIVALIMGLLFLKETERDRAAKSFDIPGVVLLSVGLFLLVWALIKAPGYGWGDAKTLGFLGGALVTGLLFVLRESRTQEPLLPLRLFRSLALSAGTVLVLVLAFCLFGAMFYMTFYLQNLHGLSAVEAAVRMLPLTGLMVVGSPLASVLINRFGPRPLIVIGMLVTSVSLFGLSTLDTGSGTNDTLIWFALLGIGLAPIMVGATEVIVGNAEVELAGVAGGLQSTSMQIGGTLGTAVLGAVMSAKLDDVFTERWAAAHLPALSGEQLAQAKDAVSVGVAPVTADTPPAVAETITQIAHSAFMDGMHLAFVVAGCVSVAGALIGLLTKQGRKVEGAVVHI
ncbi:drug resistance transporter, EmrB/QacA subfamily [Streptomyces sp. 3213]|uniref:MFS transporter n=1 Tax=Streptomyces sp. 3213.3 TaxID=1855348 RepID=UPI000898AC31|nr:drug resistance transporter, EmrB/QacA subfamily [Streptomyces sp. 3213] [Streptomyces sp. 3213.3]